MMIRTNDEEADEAYKILGPIIDKVIANAPIITNLFNPHEPVEVKDKINFKYFPAWLLELYNKNPSINIIIDKSIKLNHAPEETFQELSKYIFSQYMQIKKDDECPPF